VKAQFGPTLPQLLAPRIDSLPRIVARILGVLGVLAVLAIVCWHCVCATPSTRFPGRRRSSASARATRAR
jgi:hypothetical protein